MIAAVRRYAMKKSWMLAMFAAAIGLALFVAPGGEVSSVQAIPILDYCGNDVVDVPDSGPTFNFAEACAIHDDCYSNGGTESDRRACDAEFLSNMRASCSEMWPNQFFKRRACTNVALTYYLGVALGGWAFFPYGEQVNPCGLTAAC
jgi:hypothetical protein